jgi:ABC-2 type transport system ATP-binding protein
MGFMVAGEVVLQGSPTQIKAAQPGQLLELRIDQIQQAATVLKRHFDSWRVSIFGDRLHVVVDYPDTQVPELQAHLAAQNIQIHSLRSIPYSLEDAFISTVQRTESGTAHSDQ